MSFQDKMKKKKWGGGVQNRLFEPRRRETAKMIFRHLGD
jgi:hypothetical protein